MAIRLWWGWETLYKNTIITFYLMCPIVLLTERKYLACVRKCNSHGWKTLTRQIIKSVRDEILYGTAKLGSLALKLIKYRGKKQHTENMHVHTFCLFYLTEKHEYSL